jgi:hypothetical protein
VINPQFNEATAFSEDLAAVRSAKQWGFIDKTGKIVINSQFDKAESFSHGLAQVTVGGRIGYVDPTGKYVINLAK